MKEHKTCTQKKGVGTVRGDRGIRGAVVLSLVAISHVGCGGGGGDEPKLQVDESSSLRPLVTGLQLLNGNFELFGITTDDVVAALDAKLGALAVPVNGDHVQQIDATSDQVGVAGPVIYSFHGVDPTSTFGDLTIWTSMHGLVSFASRGDLADRRQRRRRVPAGHCPDRSRRRADEPGGRSD